MKTKFAEAVDALADYKRETQNAETNIRIKCRCRDVGYHAECPWYIAFRKAAMAEDEYERRIRLAFMPDEAAAIVMRATALAMGTVSYWQDKHRSSTLRVLVGATNRSDNRGVSEMRATFTLVTTDGDITRSVATDARLLATMRDTHGAVTKLHRFAWDRTADEFAGTGASLTFADGAILCVSFFGKVGA